MSAVAENIPAEMPDPIIFTESAAAKVADLIAEEGNPELKLRVFVQGGGCSGFQYGFTFDEITNDDDTVMTKNGVSLLIDAMSFQYLVGAEIDYKEDLQGAQFVIKNPAPPRPAAAVRASPDPFPAGHQPASLDFTRVDAPQHTGALGARCHQGRLPGRPRNGLAGQPGKRCRLHLQGGQTEGIGRLHLERGQQPASAP